MKGRSGKYRRQTAVLAPVLALFALAILRELPHWWHDEGAGIICSICQTARLPILDDAVAVRVSLPSLSSLSQPVPAPVAARGITVIKKTGRAPPAFVFSEVASGSQ